MKSVARALSALSVLSLLLTLPATAQSIAGAWDATMETPGGTQVTRMILVVDGEKVTGTLKRASGDVALVGTIVADTLRFTYTIEYNSNAFTLAVVAAKVADGFKGTVNLGGQANEAWWAVRAPAPESGIRRFDR